jgi:tape measure domain-containing protein
MMATTTVGNLLLQMSIQGNRQVITALQSVTRETNKVSDSTKKVSKNSSILQNVLGGLTGGFMMAIGAVKTAIDSFKYFFDVLKDGIKTGVNYNKEIDYYRATIASLTGDQKVANDLLQEMVVLAAETPFQVTHYAKAASVLMGYGVSQKDVMKDMKMLGDLSMGNAEKFKYLTKAYADVIAKGRLKGEEIRQFTNQGFSPLQQLVESTGMSFEELDEKMRANEITTDMVRQSFMDATGENGRFYKSMENLSNTFSGQQEKIKEYSEMFWGNLIKPFYDMFASKILPRIADHMKKSADQAIVLGQKLYDASKKAWEFLKPYYEMAKPIVLGVISKIKDNFNKFKEILPGVILLVKRFAKAFKVGNFQFIEGLLKNLFPKSMESSAISFSNILQKIRNAVVRFIDIVVRNFPKVVNKIQELGTKAMPIIASIAIPIINRLMKAFADIDITSIATSFSQLGQSIGNWLTQMKPVMAIVGGIFVVALNVAMGAVSGLISSIDEMINFAQGLVSIFIDISTLIIGVWTSTDEELEVLTHKLLDDIVKTFKNFGLMIWNILKNIVGGLVDGFKTLYDIVVGHSIIPDMVNAVIKWFKKLIVYPINYVIRLKDRAVSTFRSMYSYVKTTASNMYNYVKNKFRFIYNTTKDSFSFTYNTIKSKMTLILSIIRSKINSILSQFGVMKAKIITKIKSINLYKSGQNLINGFIKGIKSKIQAAKNAVSNVSQTVKDYLGWHSPTKKGAGSDSDKWIPNLMDMMIKEFNNYKRKLEMTTGALSNNIFNGLANANRNTLSGMMPSTSTSTSYGGNVFNITINAGSGASGRNIGRELIQELNGRSVLTHK